MNKRGPKQAPFFYFLFFCKNLLCVHENEKQFSEYTNEKQAIADPRVE